MPTPQDLPRAEPNSEFHLQNSKMGENDQNHQVPITQLNLELFKSSEIAQNKRVILGLSKDLKKEKRMNKMLMTVLKERPSSDCIFKALEPIANELTKIEERYASRQQFEQDEIIAQFQAYVDEKVKREEGDLKDVVKDFQFEEINRLKEEKEELWLYYQLKLKYGQT